MWPPCFNSRCNILQQHMNIVTNFLYGGRLGYDTIILTKLAWLHAMSLLSQCVTGTHLQNG
jgi:hypothetical protein